MFDTGIVAGLSAGIGIISYSLDWGCSTTVAVTVYALPAVGAITGISPVCVGATETLHETVPGGLWSVAPPGIATVDSLSGIVNALSLGTAIIKYSVGPNLNGCSNDTTFNLRVVTSTFTPSAIVQNVKCYGQNDGSIAVYTTGGTQPLHYLWSSGATGSAITGLAPGHYTVTIIDVAAQCADTETITVTQPDSITVTPIVEKDYCNSASGSIEIMAAGGVPPYSYLWSNNLRSQGITRLNAGTYTLKVYDMNGCSVGLNVDVPDTACPAIIIHDAISPNGDGINDTWVIEHIQEYPACIVKLFDKWGDEIFSAKGYNNDWGGAGKNGPVPDGTYYYLVKLNSAGAPGGRDSYTGSLLVKR